jgi:hypothetical protein
VRAVAAAQRQVCRVHADTGTGHQAVEAGDRERRPPLRPAELAHHRAACGDGPLDPDDIDRFDDVLVVALDLNIIAIAEHGEQVELAQ